MPRAVTEWFGKHPDAKVPAAVRLRIFRAYEGRCYLSGREIKPGEKWELEHKVALILGGEHRESNLAPALSEFHKTKTAAEMKVKAKTDAIAKKHTGITRPSSKLAAKKDKPARTSRHEPLPPRQIYREVG